MQVPGQPPFRLTFGQACRDVRTGLDVELPAVAASVGITPSYLGRIERGLANPTSDVVERLCDTLGIHLVPDVSGIVVRGRRGGDGPRDTVHARCSACAERRMRSIGWHIAREVEVIDGRYHGWIDLLAFHPVTGRLLIIEIKTRLDDIGAIERQVRWYERLAPTIAAERGWVARSTTSLVLLLASHENEQAIRVGRDALGLSFPVRGMDVLDVPAAGSRGLALIDPRRRGRTWLMRPAIDGRRTVSPFRDYADAASRLTIG